MDLDIRKPMGWLFLAFGLILAIYGAAFDPATHAGRQPPVNIDLWWGLGLAAFGGTCLLLAWRAGRR